MSDRDGIKVIRHIVIAVACVLITAPMHTHTHKRSHQPEIRNEKEITKKKTGKKCIHTVKKHDFSNYFEGISLCTAKRKVKSRNL